MPEWPLYIDLLFVLTTTLGMHSPALGSESCDKAQKEFKAWLDTRVKYDCKIDSDCRIQKLLPFPCAAQIVVAKPGFPETERNLLESKWSPVRTACKVSTTVACEGVAFSAKCEKSRCVNGHSVHF